MATIDADSSTATNDFDTPLGGLVNPRTVRQSGGRCGCRRGGGTGTTKKTTKPPTTKKTTVKTPSHKRGHATYGQIRDFTQRYGISPPPSWGGRKTRSKTQALKHRTRRRRRRM